MVSRKQSTLAVLAIATMAAPAFSEQHARKFYADDPLLREPAPLHVKAVATRQVDEIYEFLNKSFAASRPSAKSNKTETRRALDINTLGEAPDSAWYTNRHYYRRMSLEELQRGPGNSTPPSPVGTWRVISAKTDGITAGFAIEDQHKNRYLLKLDPNDYPELASAADVIGSKVFHALGYNTPENYIVRFHREKLEIAEGVNWRDATGQKRKLSSAVLDSMLKAQPKRSDGTYRALASRWLPGKLAGPFNYEGSRKDDPNDIIAHEDRRTLRGLNVFAAWLNHYDTRSMNSMDSLVEENGIQYVKHYLLDFGSTLGSGGWGPKYPWAGHQHFVDHDGALAQVVTLGFFVPRWARASYPKLTGVGVFDSSSFDPLVWKPGVPNPAFLRMDREDAFWAAKQVAAFSDGEIRALVDTGQLGDARAADWVTSSLIQRRDKIAETWFARLLPLDAFRIVDGRLAFEDLGAHRDIGKKHEHTIRWAGYTRDGLLVPLPGVFGARIPEIGDAGYLIATIAPPDTNGGRLNPVTVYLRRGRAGMEVVGIER